MNLDSEQTGRDDGSSNKHTQNRSTSKGTAWEDRLSELADYRKIHGHCNVPQRYKENLKLATWATTQRRQYGLQQEGKPSYMTPSRIKALESLGFEWDMYAAAWDGLLYAFADSDE